MFYKFLNLKTLNPRKGNLLQNLLVAQLIKKPAAIKLEDTSHLQGPKSPEPSPHSHNLYFWHPPLI
jgi:hypothetical protein